VFDQGVGDLFVVRVAGNVADPVSVASLAYAVEVLGVGAIYTMGHGHCGAVKAALAVAEGTSEAGEFAALVDPILPAVQASETADHDAWLDAAIRANAQQSARQLPELSPIIAAAVSAGELRIEAAVFDLESSRVELLD
jgi:carbonic anhydrase